MSEPVQIDRDMYDRVREAVRWVEDVRASFGLSEESAAAQEPALVKFTGTTGTSGTGAVQKYDGSTFTGLSAAVNLVSMNGEYLKQDSYYVAHRIGPNTDFVTSPGAIRVGAYYGVYRLSFTGSGFTVTETTAGQVSVSYTENNTIIVDGWGTDEIVTDTTTGIYSTNDGVEPTTTTLHLSAAGYGAWGAVSTAGQTFSGAKTFADGIYVYTHYSAAYPVSIRSEWITFGIDSGPAVQITGDGLMLTTELLRTGAPYGHGGDPHSGLSLGSTGVSIYRGFWDGFSMTRDNSNAYNLNLFVQGSYCVDYWDGAAWQGATGATGTIGPGATCRGGIVVGSGSTGLTGTVP